MQATTTTTTMPRLQPEETAPAQSPTHGSAVDPSHQPPHAAAMAQPAIGSPIYHRKVSHGHASTSNGQPVVRYYRVEPRQMPAKPAEPWFSRWTAWHVVGIILSFSLLLLATAIITALRMFRPAVKVMSHSQKFRFLRSMLMSSLNWPSQQDRSISP